MSWADFLIDCNLDIRLGIDTLDEMECLNQEFGAFPDDPRRQPGPFLDEGIFDEEMTLADEEAQ